MAKNRKRKNFAGIALLLLLASAVGSAQGQLDQMQGLLPEGRISNYRFASPGELTITVGLVGAVRPPGRYEVSRSVDLLDLLALAGGWTEFADLSEVSINRIVAGSDKGVRQTVVFDLSDFKELQRTTLALQSGDYVFIGTSRGITTSEIISYVTAVAVLVTTYITITNRN